MFTGFDIPEFSVFGITIPNIHIGLGVLIIAAVILAVYLIFAVFKISLKLFVKFLINALIGAALLMVSNLIFGNLLHIDALTLPINWLTSVVTGVLGGPGVIILLIIRFFTV
ncbi:MAG: pro-sigmaK processing inhibitor BofA family protein [Clostridia bacterium]|nr:pro-sigmaK processing inhibitor BofA family protein [Clostridia bacterium]